MPQGNPKPGELYLHFKNKMYQIVTVAKHSETGEKLVVYQALYGDFHTCARPFDMFTSLVDTEKYPQVEQKYRFQLIEPSEQEKAEQEKTEHQKAGADVVPSKEQAVMQKQSEQTKQREQLKTAEEKEPSTPEEKMMAFFDADTIEEKYRALLKMSDCITDHMINNMAVVLDIVIKDGPVDKRFEELKNCLRTMQRYETTRLR